MRKKYMKNGKEKKSQLEELLKSIEVNLQYINDTARKLEGQIPENMRSDIIFLTKVILEKEKYGSICPQHLDRLRRITGVCE
jgi:hypothetical protein